MKRGWVKWVAQYFEMPLALSMNLHCPGCREPAGRMRVKAAGQASSAPALQQWDGWTDRLVCHTLGIFYMWKLLGGCFCVWHWDGAGVITPLGANSLGTHAAGQDVQDARDARLLAEPPPASFPEPWEYLRARCVWWGEMESGSLHLLVTTRTKVKLRAGEVGWGPGGQPPLFQGWSSDLLFPSAVAW